jgi:exonuclease III
MQYLKEFVLNEYSKGNYIIVGGDWNQNPPGFDPSAFNNSSGYENFTLEDISSDFLPEGWSWNFDISHPSNRSLKASYKPGKTATTILDFFLCSPNIIPRGIRTVNLDFENSDHQPVLISIKFRK